MGYANAKASGFYQQGDIAKQLWDLVGGRDGNHKILTGISNMFTQSFEMINRIALFNARMTYLVAGIGALDRQTLGIMGKIADTPLGRALNWIDENTLQFGSRAKALLDSGFSIEQIAAVDKANSDMVTSGSMWMFSLGTSVGMPILGPALQHMPGLGTIMKVLNRFGDNLDNKFNNETINTIYEEGFKENVAGAFGKVVFGDSAAGEIFQELFDSTPDGDIDIFSGASGNTNIKTQADMNALVQQIKQAGGDMAAVTQRLQEAGLQGDMSRVAAEILSMSGGNVDGEIGNVSQGIGSQAASSRGYVVDAERFAALSERSQYENYGCCPTDQFYIQWQRCSHGINIMNLNSTDILKVRMPMFS